MSTAFIIMQIGNTELDRVCGDAIVPALKACGLDPKRVDKHNQGGLLKSEIIAFIEAAEIIVADLTNERPNCYLEVGYTMGMDKFRNLILTARNDHNQDSPDHKADGPKVHFDLRGYDVLFWEPDKIQEFRAELEKRIKRRQMVLVPTTSGQKGAWDEVWISEQRNVAHTGLKQYGRQGFLEVMFALSPPKPSKAQQDLLEAAGGAVLSTTGWPFGLAMTKDEYKPRPRTFGVVAEVLITRERGRNSYDYWAIKRDTDFYLLRNLVEDVIKDATLFFNVRIVQVTEALLYCARLYSRLGVQSENTVTIAMRHGGLRGRILDGSGGRSLHWTYRTTEDEVSTQVTLPLVRIESELVNIVKRFTEPVFTLFDFFKLDNGVYDDIVNRFVAGEVS